MDSNSSDTPDMIGDTSSVNSVDTDSVAFSNVPPKEPERVKIAEKETIAVSRLRQVVFTVLVISAIGFAFAVFFWTKQAELQNFEDAFYENSDKVLEGVGTSLLTTLGAIDVLLVNIVSFAKYSNSSWPFVTVPDYAVRAAKVRSLSKAVLVSQYHSVTNDERRVWEDYSVANDQWVEQGIQVQQNDETYQGKSISDYNVRGDIHDETGTSSAPGPYLPMWQQSPIVPIDAPYNYNGYSSPGLVLAMEALMSEKVVISKVNNLFDPSDPSSEEQVKKSNEFIKNYMGEDVDVTAEPFSDIFYPILGNAADSVSAHEDSDDASLGGVFSLTFYWRDLLTDILPNGNDGLVVVIGNACDQTFTYEVNGPNVQYLGPGDRHEGHYNNAGQHSAILDLGPLGKSGRYYTGLPQDNATCPYFLSVYPSQAMKDSYMTTDPIIYASMAILIFIFTGIYFWIYDSMLELRQKKVMNSAVRSNAIVSSLFPSTVRDRLFQQENDELPSLLPTRSRLKTYLDDEGASQSNVNDSRPIADLFSDTTVMFADIAGFTAWSSVHEPAQVFTLLETLYGAFDDIAVRRGVFKVETIGDSYVAVTGLPEPRADHAIVMVKFARDCRSQMDQLTRHLEKTLGPGTGDLQLRFGLHSGPTTAGVLRGQKSRFQLFGDTVNTAARMESTGIKSRIQVSEATAALIKAAGKAHWVKPRNELVMAKGKGNMQTYWIEPRAGGHDPSNSLSQGSFSGTSSVTSLSNDTNEDKIERLIEWNTDILASLVKHITARHKIMKSVKKPSKVKTEESISGSYQGDGRVLDEVKDIFEMPAFDGRNCNKQESPDLIELDTEVVSQLRDYVVTIALQYHNNPFHNFDHASHVGMSVAKLMSRIIGPDSVLERQSSSRTMNSSDGALASTLHDHTYGITSDPLTQFACVYAALIHDVDHQGVPNTQLVKENAPVAVHYKGKSVAEQNSVDIAWNLLMEPSYDALRNAICPTEEELLRFRKLVVNSVMATDIMDKDLKNLRNARWEKAFDETDIKVGGARDNVNRKATIVIEHLIQASDVAHTMQHWHVYRKWNERLFEEMYVAYKAGRAEKDPSEFWYQGELGFFDFYIIPLAKKLSECGVFGVASDEYLNYAQKNREEWEERGKEIVASMLTKLGNTDAGSAK